jgi:hypothetical protein
MELYFVLSFEPLLSEEIYELARRSGLRSLTQFLNGIPLMRVLYRIVTLRGTCAPWFYHEHVRLLLAVLEHRGLVKITEVPISLSWLEVNEARLWAVPPDRLTFWREWVALTDRLAQLQRTPEHEEQYQRCMKVAPMAEMVQKRPWGRKTPPKEVPRIEHAWQGA